MTVYLVFTYQDKETDTIETCVGASLSLEGARTIQSYFSDLEGIDTVSVESVDLTEKPTGRAAFKIA